MCATLIWTISDFPAYSDLFEWCTKGCAVCPYCMGNTWSKQLRNGEKSCYMGHRRWLPKEHSFRTDSLAFDGTQEMDHLPTVPNGDEIMSQLEGVQCVADRGGKIGTYTRPVYNPWVPVTRLAYTQTRPV
jgi:hypothetical protein